jgi:tRNA nucleotidyltransferase/poly(A) polymerase
LVDLSHSIDQLFEQRNLLISKKAELAHFTINDAKPLAYKSGGESEFVFFGMNIDLDILRSFLDYFTNEYTPTNNITLDLNTRDFTVNCLYYNHREKALYDPAGGLNDLKINTLKFIHPEKNTFLTAPYTIFRLIKMSVKYSMRLDKGIETILNDEQFQKTFVLIFLTLRKIY